ncbi:hypothetical protein FB554_0758 [Barrientosiimonas humi]|uniref:Uncharacterized protein n=1 Tax=Barrientosiimonas humi TaxID=999931 RepID=A0A542XA55_9MICO|nr:hypothetical protein [Barrientosiimonas humi]TQL32626.1 hypothetical protein FB554_0758 [Barrientosiimonas humi]CAG7572617.1 hypothetical protein BH39T_PBIAJDOK_01240 [Barrientosiimonas humi]
MRWAEQVADRLRTAHRSALLLEVWLLLAGTVFLVLLTVAGSPSWYALAWLALFGVVLVLPASMPAQLLVPASPLVWWFAQPDPLSAWSIPAACALLVIFAVQALLNAAPDGPPPAPVVLRRYVRRVALVAITPAAVWLLTRGLAVGDLRLEAFTVLGLAAVAATTLALPRLVRADPPPETPAPKAVER